jgi:hypothetical protein
MIDRVAHHAQRRAVPLAHVVAVASGLLLLLHLLVVHPLHLSDAIGGEPGHRSHTHDVAERAGVVVSTAGHAIDCAAPSWIAQRPEQLVSVILLAVAVACVVLRAGRRCCIGPAVFQLPIPDGPGRQALLRRLRL